jgi:hypothetical protein
MSWQASGAPAGSFQDLFNGRNLDGWVVEGNPNSSTHPDGHPVWSVQDGKIVCDGKGFGFLRYDGQQYGDFTFHVEFKMAPKCNTGLGFRTTVYEADKTRATRPSFYSYEIQLVDDAGKPATATSSGSLYRYIAPRSNAIKPAGEWNTIEITCEGPRVRVVLNGEEIHDVDQTTVEALKDKPTKGYVCLQNHGGKVEFRNVRIRDESGERAQR